MSGQQLVSLLCLQQQGGQDVTLPVLPGERYPGKAQGGYDGREVYAYRVARGQGWVRFQLEVL